MLKDINEVYNCMVKGRVQDVGDNIITKDKKYCECQEQLNYLFDEIKKKLGKESEHLICNYEEIINLQLVVAEEIIYRQAVKDFKKLETLVS
ncbi:hypothetical protein Ccar_17695 [Clostridium carboxidivorans P7]|uniref:Uncharacterized protein n=1 Tax=Clostridium carboxidivorans P7 TaxID=536227 RepID=C6PSG1_9CLOT|nr:hypothetical protein [Clostridium carboxidivorans]AKN32581.1 hypothetical protein Ccar_17695 [Clostridium carboxidivorans P7]EET87839.1 hypothetical protein CcarbDRAFT_1728 [Clostridium carboxidivorans P7]EFG90211.1 hypothetical protein CLCAR_0417 [Clostridium carboxidivorans P7]